MNKDLELKRYALKILSDASFDLHTYGGEFSTRIMDDLKRAYPNGMKYPYIDVANTILSMSTPKPIVRSPYRVVFSNGIVTCDRYSHDSLEEAKLQCYANPKSYVYVEQYNPETDEYDKIWCPSDGKLEAEAEREEGGYNHDPA